MGLQNQSFLGAGQWQAQVAYQYADTDQFFVGDQRVLNPNPNGPVLYGTPPHRKVSIFDLDVFYGISNRLSLDLTLPFLSGSGGVVQGTPASHQLYEYHAGGLGDVALQAEYWLNDPTKPSRVSGSVDMGIKAPTGSNNVQGTNPAGVAAIDEAFQLGNGGWELLLRAQGYGQVVGSLFAYASGYYGLSLTTHTDVKMAGAFIGVPDTYSGRLGAAYLLPMLQGLVVSFGGRINGVTVKDIIGGGDLYWRRPGYEVYVEPGLTWTIGANSASVSVPVRVYQNKLNSLLDISQGAVRGSDFAPFLVVASFARRF